MALIYDFNLKRWVEQGSSSASLTVTKPNPTQSIAVQPRSSVAPLPAVKPTNSIVGPVQPLPKLQVKPLPTQPTIKPGGVSQTQTPSFNPQTPSQAATQIIQPAAKNLDLTKLQQLKVSGVDGTTPPVYTPPKKPGFLDPLKLYFDAQEARGKMVTNVAKAVVQGTARSGAAIATEYYRQNYPELTSLHTLPESKISKILFGPGDISGFQSEGQKTLQAFGLNKASDSKALSYAVGGGLAISDLFTGGGKDDVLKAIAKSDKLAEVVNLARKAKVPENIIEQVAPLLVKATDIDQVKKVISEGLNQTKLPIPKKTGALKTIKNSLAPIRNTDEATQEAFQTWNRTVTSGSELANKEALQLKNIVRDGVDQLLKYEQGIPVQGGDEVAAVFKSMREEGIKKGLKIAKRSNYIPQAYKNTTEQVAQAMTKYLLDNGVKLDDIKDYLDGTAELADNIVRRLKIEPSFAKQRVFPDYATAIKYGLTPKYTNIAQLAGHYRRQLEEAVANRNFVQELQKLGQVKPLSAAPEHWVDAPFLGKGKYVPPELADVLNKMGQSNPIWRATAKLSRVLQEIRLSAGVPKTSINFFSIGQLVKELTSGNVRSVGAFIRSNSKNKSIQWFNKNQAWLQKMAEHGLDLSDRVGSFENQYKHIIRSQSLGEALGRTWYKGFEEKTFASFMPQLHVQTYKSAFQRALRKGMSEKEAGELAADVTRNMFGLFENVGRSKQTDDILSTFFFAPKFRSSMITMLYNTGMAGADFVSSVGGLRKPLNPALYKNRRFLMGMTISYAAYNALNYKLNGHAMWDNESGREFALKIPTKNGDAVYIEFMPSVLSFARSLATGTIALSKGDLDTAKQKYGGIASMPINIAMQVWANKDYFGNPIYNEDDTATEKLRKIAVHVGLQTNHPYIQAIVDQIDPVYEKLVGEERKGRKKSIIQSIFEASELPLKFSSKQQLDDKARFKIMDENEKKYNEAKRKIQPVYDNIQKIYDEGNVAEAERLVNEMSDADYEIYKNILASDKRFETSQGKKDMFPVVEEVAGYLEAGDEAAAEEIINSLDDEEYRLYELERDNIYPDGFPESGDGNEVKSYKSTLPPLEKVTPPEPVSKIQPLSSTKTSPLLTIKQPAPDPESIDSKPVPGLEKLPALTAALQRLGKKPTQKTEAKTLSNKITSTLRRVFPQGSIGGQCITFLHKIVDFPQIGDFIGDKRRAVAEHGIPLGQWKKDVRVGDIVVTNEDKTYGHGYMIEEILPDGRWRVLESNRNYNQKVTHDRIVSPSNPNIIGAIRGKIKVS